MADEQDLMRKISGLLAKAEGTDSEHESDAFYAKAHELMVKYAIDEEQARQVGRRAGRHVEEPMVEDYMFSTFAHHAQAKLDLVKMVAKSQSVKYFTYSNRKDSNLTREGNRGLHESQWIKFVGYRDDIGHVKMLYVSLLIQSQRFAAEDWRRQYGEAKTTSAVDEYGWSSSRSLGKFAWMSNHMEGFAGRIGERFRELTADIYRSTAGANTLITDKEANIMEWMYENGLAYRPRAADPNYVAFEYCYKLGIPPRKRSEYYCIKQKGHEVATDVALGTPHDYTYKPAPGSSYVAKGRNYEGRSAGRAAADRADIGNPRVGNDAKLVKS